MLRLIEDQAQIGVWCVNLHDSTTIMSDGLLRIAGLPHPSNNTDALIDLIHPADWRIREEIWAALMSGLCAHRELRIVRPDRTVRWIEIKADVVLGPDGQPMRLDGIVIDITSRREAAQSVDRSQTRYQGLVQAIAAVVWIMNVDGVYWPCPSWCELTGQSEAEWRRGGWALAIHEEDRARAKQAWATALERREPYAANYRLRCKDGQYRWVNSRAVPLLNADQTVREWIGLILDMTSSAHTITQPSCARLENLTGPLVRAARAMLNWSIPELAAAAKVSDSSVKRFEESSGNVLRPRTRAAIRSALEAAGICFTVPSPGEVGLRYRARPPASAQD
ncbi:PAS domain-containing protein [Methylobacterium sp. J-068]|uniref:PAS domain-containing protein n=1 Tax=Methylobacterium sp. J-068 TaxID=2836649 RepID=UPI001FB9B054|nr:PAS domain-containing protein [Methylobacterium sp. J-068]MCJ2033983.1 PAS domain-containing protein [Methylobacterium sp. J-068]